MRINISFDNGTAMSLDNVKTFGFDAEDSAHEEVTTVRPPEFIREKIKDNNQTHEI
jgi:hypothetical protein